MSQFEKGSFLRALRIIGKLATVLLEPAELLMIPKRRGKYVNALQ
jgi:hypothetical protein